MGYNSKNIDKLLNQLPDNLNTINDIIPWMISRLG
jgi:uncharacterized protein YbaP (TraB family)